MRGLSPNKKRAFALLTQFRSVKLPDLGSNQGSSPPKGDVLPVTPSGNQYCLFQKGSAKIKYLYVKQSILM